MRNATDHLQGTNFKCRPLCWLESALLLLFSFVSFSVSTEVLLETTSSSSVFSSTLSSTGAAVLCSVASALGLSSELSGSGAGAADSALGSAVLSVSAVKDHMKQTTSLFLMVFQEDCYSDPYCRMIQYVDELKQHSAKSLENTGKTPTSMLCYFGLKLNCWNWRSEVVERFHNDSYCDMDLISGWWCFVFNTNSISSHTPCSGFALLWKSVWDFSWVKAFEWATMMVMRQLITDQLLMSHSHAAVWGCGKVVQPHHYLTQD